MGNGYAINFIKDDAMNEVFKVRNTKRQSSYVTPKLTFKDLDNIEFALSTLNEKLRGYPRKQVSFRKTYLKIYMAIKKQK